MSRRIGIPAPFPNLQSLTNTAQATTEVLEVLTGSRGDPHDRAVRLIDLINLKLINESQIAELDALERQRSD